ncbi:serine/threonine-protein phosphatase 7 long form homolog [Bidens hawaiensis]|uniref:serine/threonine-protein phosphatase 7 long form homolog n=1 Tax=Bidens hawaiensis TaxID=980011 RepID=UPI00404A3069
MEYTDLFGFGGIVRCGYRKVDRALVEALVERWRPETNTFHLPCGEATVTLEGVNVLWGLPIEGEALAGYEESFDYNQWRQMCYTYLGFTTKESDYKNQFLKLKCIVNYMLDYPITEESTDRVCMQRARCVCLIVASSNMLADTNNGYASLHLLYHLKDYQVSGRLSWGSAALACLYRELYKGSKPQTKAVGGPMSLLQVWAWTRIRPMRPTIVNQQIDWSHPYGVKY